MNKSTRHNFDAIVLSKVIEIQQSVATVELDLQKTMDLIVSRTQELTQADGGVIEMTDGDEMVYRAVSGTASNQLGLRLKISNSLSGRCTETGETLNCVDSETDPRVNLEACRKVGLRSMILVPLKDKDRIAGVLKVFSTAPNAFNEQDIQVLKLMSGLLGAALSRSADFEAQTRTLHALQIREREVAQLNSELQRKIDLHSAELQSDRDKFKNLTEVFPMIVWTADPDGEIEYFNSRWYQYSGVTRGTPLMHGWNTAIHHDDSESTLRHWKKAVASGERYEAEYRLRRASDGEYRWHVGSALPTRDADGKIINWFGTCTDIHEQKELVRSTLENKARTDAIVSNASVILWSIDETGKFTYSEGKGLERLGLNPGERVGKSIFDIYRDKPPIIDSVNRALQGERTQVESYIGNTWFETFFTPLQDAQGQVTGVVGVSMDNSERKRLIQEHATLQAEKKAAAALRASEAHLRAIFDSALDGIIGIDKQGLITEWNPQAEKIFGWTKEEAVGRKMSETIIPSEYREAHEFGMRRFLSSGHGPILNKSIEVSAIRRNGEIFPIELTVSPIQVDGHISFTAFASDISDRKQAEESLQKTTKTLQTLIESCPLGILFIDLDQKIQHWNPACERIFGWTAEEILGHDLPFVPSDQRADSSRWIEQLYEGREKQEAEVDRVKKDGSPIRISVSAMPLIDENGALLGHVSVISDITERARAEAELHQAKAQAIAATEAKSRFLANMSHEIRTPLNGVIGMTTLLLDTPLSPEQRDYVDSVRTAGDTLLTLINDILDFSKIEAGKYELESIPFDVEQVIQDIERTLIFSAKKKGIKLLKSTHPDLPLRFVGDPTRLRQVLLNLVNNAIKFTEQGYVAIEVTHERVTDQRIRLRFEVTDTGIGIPQEAQQRMFMAFSQADASTTRRFGGTGLGLSISKHLVHAMGGEIGLSSQEGKGSTFWFTLILPESLSSVLAQSDGTEFQHSSVSTHSRSLRILLAEDNSVNQRIALKMLEKLGHRAVAVANGLEAIHALKTAPYDLILMDCQMPELDGYEATRQIRAERSLKQYDIPIIAMTANAMTGDREKCLAAGMNHYVTKPIQLKNLAAAIAETLFERVKTA